MDLLFGMPKRFETTFSAISVPLRPRAQVVEQRVDLLVREVLVELLAVDLEHWRRSARPEALDLGDREETVLGRVAARDTETALDVTDDVVGAHDHARRRAADLQVVLAHRLVVVHGVEGDDLAHGLRRNAMRFAT